VATVSETPARYDAIADFYEAFAPDVYDEPPTSSLLSLIGDVSGLRIVDVACGHGRLSRELARRGAKVVGLDISARLLDKARSREETEPIGITYIQADAASPDTLEGEVFDGATCGFALSDMDDLDGAIASVARLVRPGGFFAFSILHPCFPGWESKGASPSWQPGRGYFEEGWWLSGGPPGGVRTKVGANHRTFSTYVNTLARNGLMIEKMEEPQPSADWIAAAPSIGPVPMYLAMRCRKGR
jgi:SAM-dependent methyltransferase